MDHNLLTGELSYRADRRGLPRLPSGVIERPRLFEKLQAGSPLTLLRAPIGFGKTTLVAQWLQRQAALQATWVTLDRDSSQVGGFWQTAVEALADIGVTAPPPGVVGSAASQIRQAINRAGSDVVLVIDSFERVSDATIEETLLHLLRVSSNLRLVICLRSYRHFPPRSHLDIHASQITPTELLLTVEETAKLFAEMHVSLSREQIEAIHAKGGGWIEPTRAVALALRRSTTTTPSPSRLRTTSGEIAAAYLRERILPASAEEHIEFALARAYRRSWRSS